jgi:uncharacterized protein involved in propanediol utilization
LQGVFQAAGSVTRGLVTLPYPRFETRATIALRPSDSSVEVTPRWKVKAQRAARLALDAVGLPQVGGRLDVADAIPVAHGFGSSTADVVATIRAVCSAADSSLDAEDMARLAVESETASDPLMFDHAVLFAQRDGVVLEDFAAHLPPLEVLGFATGAREVGVPTLALPPARYNAEEVEEFEQLRRQLREAIAGADVNGVGRVATASARINQRHLPVDDFEQLARIADRAGAAGLQVAHSGDIAGLLFEPSGPDVEGRVAEAQRLLAASPAKTWRFRIS